MTVLTTPAASWDGEKLVPSGVEIHTLGQLGNCTDDLAVQSERIKQLLWSLVGTILIAFVVAMALVYAAQGEEEFYRQQSQQNLQIVYSGLRP